MPVDLTSSKTFGEMLLELAERVGKADYINPDDDTDNRARLPSDPHDLDKLKRCLNNGYRSFFNAWPHWRFAEMAHEITFAPDGDGPTNLDADGARYRLPSTIAGNPVGDWTYLGTTTPLSCVMRTDHQSIERMQQIGDTSTGDPRYCAVRPVKTKDQPTGDPTACEAVFYPAPNRALTVRATFRVRPPKLVDPAQRHVCGADHDLSIIAFAVWEWKREDATDPTDLAACKGDRDEKLEFSKAVDKAGRAPGIGIAIDTTPRPYPTARDLTYSERQRNGTELT